MQIFFMNNCLALLILFQSTACYCQSVDKVMEQNRVYSSKSAKAEKYYHEGYADLQKNLFLKAIAQFRMAIDADSNFVDAYNDLGVCYTRISKPDSAVYYYRVSLRKYPKGSVATLDLAIVAYRQNNYEKAIDYYKLYINLKREDPEGYYGLLRSYIGLKMFDQAIENGKIAEKYYKKNNSAYIGDCYNYLCIAYFSKNNREMAKTYLELAQEAGVTVDQQIVDALK